MKILQPLVRRSAGSGPVESRWSGVDELLMSYQGNQYFLNPMKGSRPDLPDTSFEGYVDGIYRRNGIVAGAAVTRALLMSQLRFAWKADRSAANRGELFWNRSLRPLDRPGTMTRAQMLFAAELDVSFSGTAWFVRDGAKIRRLIPDHVSVVLGSDSDPVWDGETDMRVPYDAEVRGIMYHPHRSSSGLGPSTVFLPGEFACWSPEPDPVHFWRGTSWVTSVLREVVSDGQATDHQQKFFERAATPNVVVIMDPSRTPTEVNEYAEAFNSKFGGSQNAYKNWFIGGGSDVKTIGSTLDSLNLKDLTGGFENRIAIRSRIPAVILGAREGLSGSSLNAGNYGSARRLLADGWFAPAADSLCQSLEAIVAPPRNAELAYDRSEVLFLQEDQKDAADIASTNAAALRQLVDGGFDPQSAIDAVATGDMAKLKHSGQLSVQLQPPGDGNGRMPDGMSEGNDDDND